MTSVMKQYDNRLGMVAARLEHLERIVDYGLARTELVILPRDEEAAVKAFLALHPMQLSVHAPLFRDVWSGNYPLLAALFDTDPERAAHSAELFERELQQAHDWGATYMVAHLQRSVGVLGEPFPDGWNKIKTLDLVLPAIEKLWQAAERLKMGLHLENMMSHPLFASPDLYIEIFEHFAVTGLQMCFDVGHAAFDGAKYGYDVIDFARELAPHIGSIHLYNNQVDDDFDFAALRESGRIRKFPVHPTHQPDENWIDIPGVLEAVLTRNPATLVTFEVYFALDTSREMTQEGLNWAAELCRPYN